MDYYQLLGIERDASDNEIKKAYRKAASKAHPDKEGGSHGSFLELQKAFDTLIDPFSRKAYDLGCPGATLELEVAEAKKELTNLFIQLATRAASTGTLKEHIDLVGELRSFVDSGIMAIGPQLKEPLRVAKALRKVHRKLKKKDAASSFLHDALNAQRKENWKKYRELQGNRRHLQLMINLVDQYEYEVEPFPDPFAGFPTSGVRTGRFVSYVTV